MQAAKKIMFGVAAALTTAGRSAAFVQLPRTTVVGRHAQLRHFMTSKNSQAAQIYVANISFDSDEQRLKEYFEQYGKVAKIDLPRDRNNTAKNRGFGFVTFESQQAADNLVRDASSSHSLEGRDLLLSRSHPRGQRNPNRFDTEDIEAAGEGKKRRPTLYTINDSVCPPTDKEALQKIVTKHCKSLDKYLENSPIAAHTRAAFVEVKRYANIFFPEGIPNASSNSDEPGLILDSGVGTGRSSRMLAERYPNDLIIGVDRSFARLSKNDNATVTSEDNDESFVQVVEGQPNVLLVRAELGSFWRLIIEEGWAVKSQYLLYPNPYPKPRRVKSRFYAHPIFPVLLSVGDDIIVRSNWEGYLKEFAASASIVSECSETVSMDCAGKPILSEPLTVDGPNSVVVENEESALTLFEKKYYECGEPIYELRVKREYFTG